MGSRESTRPPAWAVAFFHWFCRPNLREEIEGDLLERFNHRSEQYGSMRNRLLFIKDVLSLFRPQIIGNFHHLAFIPLSVSGLILVLGFMLFLFVPVWIFSIAGLQAYASTNCSVSVIDSYEVRSGIDIPNVDFYHCYCDEGTDIRMSVYKLKVDVNDYLIKARYDGKGVFKLIDLKDVNLSLPLPDSEKPVSKQLYISIGTKSGNTWRYVVEKESGRLWVEMKFTPGPVERYSGIAIALILPLTFLLLVFFLYNISRNLYLHFQKWKIAVF